MFKKVQSLFCILHPACVLLLVCSLHFALSLQFTPGLQSAVCSPQSAFYADRYCKYFLMYQSILKLPIRNSHISHSHFLILFTFPYFSLFSLFPIHISHSHFAILKKQLICQWCERMYLCGFVALYVRMFVAGAKKVEGTMS